MNQKPFIKGPAHTFITNPDGTWSCLSPPEPHALSTIHRKMGQANFGEQPNDYLREMSIVEEEVPQ